MVLLFSLCTLFKSVIHQNGKIEEDVMHRTQAILVKVEECFYVIVEYP